MATKAASVAYRVFDVGIEHQVKSYTAEWKDSSSTEGKKPKKYLDISVTSPDAMLAYADIVCISDSDIEAYRKALGWQKKSRDMHFLEAKKERPEGAAFLSVLRVYWYHSGTTGLHNNNIGFADLLSSTTLPDAVKAKFISEGNKGVQEAFTLMRKIKDIHIAKGAVGSHLATRPFTKMDRGVGRTIITGLVDGRNFNWDAGASGNRNRSHVWKEDVHGKVMDAAWRLHLNRKASDSSMNDLAALADGISSVEETVLPSISSTKIVEFEYSSATGKVWKGYRLPDGTEIKHDDIKRFGATREKYWQQEGMLDNNQGEEND